MLGGVWVKIAGDAGSLLFIIHSSRAYNIFLQLQH